MDCRETDQTTSALIEALAKRGYMQIAALIDGNHLDEARQVADILKEVGIV